MADRWGVGGGAVDRWRGSGVGRGVEVTVEAVREVVRYVGQRWVLVEPTLETWVQQEPTSISSPPPPTSC